MKNIQLIVLLFSFSGTIKGQNTEPVSSFINEAYPVAENTANNPCIHSWEYALLDNIIAENLTHLQMENAALRTHYTTSLSWPVKAGSELTDCGYHFIGAYVDQNSAAGSIQDFNCGTKTYDSHQGTDIALWPYAFLKMDNNQVQVIAAAPGTIVARSDGNFDRNCTSNSLTANYIVIQHTDGSQALYWHMKKNSVTSKTVGQTVVTGEYLGIVGSSGSSSGPHLHFEMRTGSTSTTYFDPFTGPCNTSPSWWASQKPYKDPTAIKVSTNTTDIVLPGCPTTETPNEATSFNIPFQGAGLAPGYAKFYVFLRDEQNGLTGNMSILNPNGTTHTSWSFTSTGNYNASFWGFSKKLPTTTGKFTFQTVYNGKTCFTAFDIVNITGAKNQVSDKKIQIFPNPTNGKVFIKPLNPQVYAIDVTVYNAIGLTIETFSLDKQTSEFSFSLEGQPRGFYFINFNDGYINTTGKILLQ